MPFIFLGSMGSVIQRRYGLSFNTVLYISCDRIYRISTAHDSVVK